MKKSAVILLMSCVLVGFAVAKTVFAEGGFQPQGGEQQQQNFAPSGSGGGSQGGGMQQQQQQRQQDKPQNFRSNEQSQEDSRNTMEQNRPGKLPFQGTTGTQAGQFDPNRLQRKEVELKKRESLLQNPERNAKEARQALDKEMKEKKMELQKKEKEAREQRKVCMTERQTDLKALDQERVAKMKELQAACTPKTVSAEFEKPEKPSLDGVSAEEATAIRTSFQEAMKEYNQKIKEAMTACREKIKEQQQAFREKAVSLKEQCSNTERAVLGLSTEIPYNQE